MKLKTCTICRKLFSSDGTDICPICMEHIDASFQVVRNYIETSPDAPLDAYSLSVALNIDLRYVQALVRLGYLQPVENPEPVEDPESATGDETTRKIDLARQLQASLTRSVEAQEERSPKGARATMYAQDKYGSKQGEK